MLPDLSIGKEIIDIARPLLGSPGKEIGELIADRIRFWRWQSAVKIIKMAKDIREENHITQKEVPLKFFLPFIEEASKEKEDDDQILNIWAQLLATADYATTGFDLICIELLKSIGSKEASLLIPIASTHEQIYGSDKGDILCDKILSTLISFVTATDKPGTSEERLSAIEKSLVSDLKLPMINIAGVDTIFRRENTFSISTLDKLGLCQKDSFDIFELFTRRSPDREWQNEARRVYGDIVAFIHCSDSQKLLIGQNSTIVRFLKPTDFGKLFMKRCGILKTYDER